jgi:hypothetical protein
MATIYIDADCAMLGYQSRVDDHEWRWHPKAFCEFLRWETEDSDKFSRVDISRLRLLDSPVNLMQTPYMNVSVEHGQVKVDIK